MKTKLERLLENIDPVRTLEEVSARVDEAVNSFPVASGIVTDREEFKGLMARFYRHVENRVLRIAACSYKPDADFDWWNCYRLLVDEFGSDSSAFDIARTGTKRGLYGVLKAVATQMINYYAQNEIAAEVSDFWNGLSVDEMVAACDEYVSKFGHLLPPELTSKGAPRIRANFPEVLKEHPRMLKRLRSTGRGL